MADGISQSDRLFSFESPLGDSLLCNAFSGTEEMSELFHFNLELVSEDFNISWQQLLNHNVTVGIRLSDNSFRYFNGYIIRFEPVKHEGRLGYYTAEMVPWLWFLTQTQNCQIFQKKSVVQVIKTTFDQAGFSGQYDVKALGDRHVEWINCCQYRESAFDFISRLAEIEGIYYYFKHEQGKHTLMMVDHLSAHLPLPFQSAIRYAHDEGGGVLRAEDTITDCSMRKVVKPSKYAHKDYNFLIPTANLYHEGDVHNQVSGSRILEIYDYPGEFEWPKDAPDWGTLRQQELEYDHALMTGSSTCRFMAPGYRFDLLDSPRPDLDGNYLLTSVTHHAHEGSFGAGFDSSPASYDNGFSCIPSSVQFRPTRKTETPDVSSIQTATVVGPKGEEIYTDEYGRVKVHFHWDRTDASENSSCWIRVMQSWAGANWGQIWVPRVGMEVMVQFLEGDPDRPVITGCLYNEENRPPYKLPDRKNWSGIMSRSTKGGKATDFNELRFDDTAGSELYLLHAQKDMQFTVSNDTVESIKRDRTLNVKRNQIEQVEADKHGTVKGNHNEKIGGNVSQTVGGYVAVNASGDIVLKAEGNICVIAGGVINLTAGGGITMSSGGGGLGGMAGGALAGAAGGLPGAAGGLPGAAGGQAGAAGGQAGAAGGQAGAAGGQAGGAGGQAGGAGGQAGAAGGQAGAAVGQAGAAGGLPGAAGGQAGAAGGQAGGQAGAAGGQAEGQAGAAGGQAGAAPGNVAGGPAGMAAGGCFISVNQAGIIMQGSPMIWINCGFPAPPGSCNATPVMPLLPDLSHLASSTNLGGAANPNIADMAKPDAPGGGQPGPAAGQGPGAGAGLGAAPGAGGGGAPAAPGVAGALAANPWVNPASLDQPLQNQEAPDPTIDPDNLPDPEGMA